MDLFPDCFVKQKRIKCAECGLKAAKARNEYYLCLEAANAALQKYYTDDLQELINVSPLLDLHVLFSPHVY